MALRFTRKSESARLIRLPPPELEGEVSVEETLARRRSVREFIPGDLTLREVSQISWAAQGETSRDGSRTAPSAGALYPMEIYVVAGDVQDLEVGVYHYRPHGHELVRVAEGDRRRSVAAAAAQQLWIADAAVVIALCAVYGRTTRKYGERGRLYVHMEAGHIVQSISLQVVALGLGSVVVGALDEEPLNRMLGVPKRQSPICLVPVGKTE